MNLEARVQRLEALLSPEADAPLVFVKVIDQRKNSQDPGSIQIAIVPGALGHKGAFLTRRAGESECDFLSECEKKYSELYE